jgi:hypothetical protein
MADQKIIFKFRSREYSKNDLKAIRQVISENFHLGRTQIACILARAWEWKQPNGKYKEFAVSFASGKSDLFLGQSAQKTFCRVDRV